MQRCGSSSSTPIRTSAQIPRPFTFSGTVSAPVSHAAAQGMSAHAMQARTAGSMYGVPAANPPPLAGVFRIACTGQTSMQSPQRVHAATNATSGAAPGGRNQRFGATRCSARCTALCNSRPIVSWKNARRSNIANPDTRRTTHDARQNVGTKLISQRNAIRLPVPAAA